MAGILREALPWLPLLLVPGFGLAAARSAPSAGGLLPALLLGTALLARLPYVLANAPLNPDEDFALALAVGLRRDPVIFASGQPTTAGLLHAYAPLALSAIPGLQAYAYSALHALAALLHVACLVLLQRACTRLFGPEAALFGALVGLLLLVLGVSPDLLHYHSEIESLLLLSAALWLVARIETGGGRSLEAAALGLLLGLLPYAKLQSLPIGALLAVWALAALARSGARRALARALAFAAAAAAPTLALLVWLHAHGLVPDFVFYYLRTNLAYGASLGFADAALAFFRFMPHSVLAASALVTGVAVAASTRIARARVALFCAGLLLASLVAVARPGWYFPHYYAYLLLGLVPSGALAYGALDTAEERRWLRLAALLCCGAALLLGLGARRDALAVDRLRPIRPGPAAREILALATRPDDSIAVWGFYPVLNVETNLPSATRDLHSYFVTYGALRKEYARRYLADLERRRPVVFVDSRVMWVDRYVPFRRLPELARFVQEHYVLHGSFPGSRFYEGEPVDLWVAKERAGLRRAPP
jgi:hypothetical protein